MKKLLLILTAAAPLSSSILAQSASFSETYADKLVSYTEDGDRYYETVTTGRFTTRGKATFAEPLDLAGLDETTPLFIQIGDWRIDGFLGDDPKFTAGKKSATFRSATGAVIRVAFTAKSATWSVSARTGSDARGTYEDSPKAYAYAGSGETLSIAKTDGESVVCNVGLADEHFLSGNLPLSGRVKSAVKKVGSGDLVEEYPLSSVSISAAGALE